MANEHSSVLENLETHFKKLFSLSSKKLNLISRAMRVIIFRRTTNIIVHSTNNNQFTYARHPAHNLFLIIKAITYLYIEQLQSRVIKTTTMQLLLQIHGNERVYTTKVHQQGKTKGVGYKLACFVGREEGKR